MGRWVSLKCLGWCVTGWARSGRALLGAGTRQRVKSLNCPTRFSACCIHGAQSPSRAALPASSRQDTNSRPSSDALFWLGLGSVCVLSCGFCFSFSFCLGSLLSRGSAVIWLFLLAWFFPMPLAGRTSNDLPRAGQPTALPPSSLQHLQIRARQSQDTPVSSSSSSSLHDPASGPGCHPRRCSPVS